MLRGTRCLLAMLAASLVAAAVGFAAATAGAAPLETDHALPNPTDRARFLWEPKQAAFERLEETLAAPRDAAERSQDDFDVVFYDLDLVVDFPSEGVGGDVTMRAVSLVDGLSTVILNLYDSMTVASVTGNLTSLAYTHSEDLVTIVLDEPVDTGETFEVTIEYGGVPAGYAFQFRTHEDAPIASTLSEPEGAREWWPCKDTPADKADSVRIAFTVPDDLVAVCEGLLTSEIDNGDGTKTFTWYESYPITTYLVSTGITNYASWVDYYHPARSDSMPITNYVYPEDLADALIDLDITPNGIGFFASIFGEYPFIDEKYGHKEFPWGGAMEHQTCTSYGRILITGDHHYDWVLIHELAHQWWGDWVTCRTWDDIWLNEGFSVYSEALWFEDLYGFEYYKDYMLADDSFGYFDGPIYDPWATFSRTVYSKGSWTLHMLRHVLGDRDDILETLALYASEHAYGTAVTSEFQAAAETVYGGSLDWFFQQWVYGENRPYYEYAWVATYYEYAWVASDAGDHWNVMLHVDQVQEDAGVFTMPIDIVLETAAGETTVVVWNDQWSQDFFFAVDDEPTALAFDPDHWILKHLDEGTGVALAVYDVAGRHVATLADGPAAPGVHEVSWDGRDAGGAQVASGVYFARLVTDAGDASHKLLRVK